MARRVLVIDDEKGIRSALQQLLELEGVEVHTASSGGQGIDVYKEMSPHLVFLDVKMQGMDGIKTLQEIREFDPDALVIMISGHGTIETAVEAVRAGAYDFLEKPLDTDRILLTLERALEKVDLASENKRLRAHIEDRHRIVGESRALQGVLETIEKVAPTSSRVLITGDNGSGKELVARAIHRKSPRVNKPFVEVNCAAIPTELIESELFGHMKGSFTGAVQDRAGKFEQADGGTLFLDEVADMSEATQAKVLRALQEGVVTRIGGSKSIKVDVRVIAATNKALENEIAEGRFREDLYYRLAVVPIHVPSLNDRREDIEALALHFRDELAAEGVPFKEFDKSALDALRARDWPGNVRELRNAVERLMILSSDARVVAADVTALNSIASAGVTMPEASTFEQFKLMAEKDFLSAKLAEFGWNVSETARALEMPRSNLYKKIEKYGLQREG